MRIKTLLSALALGLFAVTLSPSAEAGKKKAADTEQTEPAPMVIEEVGLPTMDTFFGQVKTHCDAVNAARESMDQANAQLVTVLGLPAGTPVADALADLKTKAEGKINVVFEGTRPTLQPADAVPENVQAGIDAVNALVGTLTDVSTTLQGVVAAGPDLVAQAQGLPASVPSEAQAAGVKATEVIGITKKVKGNVAATKALPENAKALLDSATQTVELVKNTFAG